MADAEKAGIEEAGGKADIYRVEETLPESALKAMHAPDPDPNITVFKPQDLVEYDAFLLGIPTRYGNFPAQWKAFWDHTGGLWASGALHGKYVGVFVSTGTLGGGQETTALSCLSTFVHHGMTYVPLGYKETFAIMSDMNQVRGGSPWGAGTLAAPDGSRQPSAAELEIATTQDGSDGGVVDKEAVHENKSEPASQDASQGEKPNTPKQEMKSNENNNPASEGQKKEEKGGPCGLPSKCLVL
ncbi:MAG: flavodoxin-like fold protein [Sclerophora amabilis]|nr:MAG: flavodoxin-like fold protein [Sclerophora amabilis]